MSTTVTINPESSVHASLSGEFCLTSQEGKYRVRPGSLKDDNTVLVQRWDPVANDWLSDGRHDQAALVGMVCPLPSPVVPDAPPVVVAPVAMVAAPERKPTKNQETARANLAKLEALYKGKPIPDAVQANMATLRKLAGIKPPTTPAVAAMVEAPEAPSTPKRGRGRPKKDSSAESPAAPAKGKPVKDKGGKGKDKPGKSKDKPTSNGAVKSDKGKPSANGQHKSKPEGKVKPTKADKGKDSNGTDDKVKGKPGRKLGQPAAPADPTKWVHPKDTLSGDFLSVLKLLSKSDGLSQKDIEGKSKLSSRRVYHVLYWHRADNLVREEVHEGQRGRVYSLSKTGIKALAKATAK